MISWILTPAPPRTWVPLFLGGGGQNFFAYCGRCVCLWTWDGATISCGYRYKVFAWWQAVKTPQQRPHSHWQRRDAHSQLAFHVSSVQVHVPKCVLLLDRTLCSMVLDNVIGNAFRHGTSPESAVHLAVTTTPTGDGRRRLCFALTNEVSPTKPVLTKDFVARAWQGTDGAHGRQAPAHSPMSNGIGLRQTFLSAHLHDMALHLTQEGTKVRFTARVIASVAADPEPPRPADPGPFPPDLHICVIDDSEGSRQLLQHHLLHRVTRNVHVFGESVRDVEPFIKRTMAVAHIAVLDQNLEYGPEENVLGTDLIRQLVAQQFTGLICMRSGNAAAEDVAFYSRCGAHCVFGKDVPLRCMIDELKAAYLSHARQTGAVRSDAEVVSGSNAHTRVAQAPGHCGTDAPSQHNGHPPMPGVPPSDSGGLLPPAAGSGVPGPRHGAVGSSSDVASTTDHPPLPGVPPSDSGGALPLRRRRRSTAGWPVVLPIDGRGKGKQVQRRSRDAVGQAKGDAYRVDSGDTHDIMVGGCGPPSCSVQLPQSQSPSERFSRLAAFPHPGSWCLGTDTEGAGGSFSGPHNDVIDV